MTYEVEVQNEHDFPVNAARLHEAALVALVGYKFKNDERGELSAEYVDLAGKFADISAAYAPNINDYYRKVKDGVIKPPADKDIRDNTHVHLRGIAEKLGINEGTGTSGPRMNRGTPKFKRYQEYSVDVRLKNVTQSEWAVFLSRAQHETREYTHVAKIDVERAERRFARMNIVKDIKGDRSLWDVTITFVWFGPLEEA